MEVLASGEGLYLEFLAASADNSREWFVSLPESSMNQINHRAKQAEKSLVQMNKSFSSPSRWYPYFWSKKINQTAQPTIKVGCEEWIIKEVKTFGVFTKW